MADLEELRRLSRLIDKGLEALRDQATEFARCEQAYRQAKATAWIEAPEGTVDAKKAWVEGRTSDARYARDLADGLRQAALEAVRSRRGQLSAWQSWMAAERAEAEFARTGGDHA